MSKPSPVQTAHFCAAVFVALLPVCLRAQTITSWIAGAGDWTDTTKWTDGTDPNGNFDARLLVAGTITLNDARSIVNWQQSTGTLTGTGTLTVSGTTTLTGGTMSGTGTTILQGASTLGGNGLDLDAGRILRNENTVTWTAGNMSLNPANNTGSGRIDNAVGALWDAQANNTISAPGFADVNSLAGFPAFNNAGTFRKSAGTGTTTIDVAFNNTGSLQVQTGTVNLTAGGTQTAGTISGPGTIQFGGGTHTADAASNINIANATFSGGTTTFNGTYNVSNTTTVSGGTASLQNGTLTSLGNALVISAGAFNAGANNAAVTTLTQSGGTYNSSGSLTVTGGATLTGGTMSGTGTTILQGASTLGGNGLDLDAGRILRNENTVTWTAGNMSLNPANNTGSGRIDNAVGALWDAQANNTISAPGFADVNSMVGFPAFNNAGTFRKSAGTGTTTIDVAFNNTGSLQVQTGTVNLTAGGTQTAGTISGPGTIQFGGGTHTADAASNINIANATFSGGTTTFNGTYNVSNTTTVSGGTASLQNGTLTSLGNALVISAGAFNAGANNAAVTTLTQSGGTYNSSGSLTVTGAATLTGGTMSGTGTTILQGASTLGGNGLDLDAGRILRNENTVTWTAGNMSLNPANNTGSGRIDNAVGALWDAQANNTISAPGFADVNSLAGFPAFNNAGTFRKSVGIGTTTIDVAFNNTGSLQVQTGTVNLTAGGTQTAGTISGPGTIQFGGGTHTADAASNINIANATFSGGTTTFNGTYNVSNTTTVSGGTASLQNGTLTSLGNALVISAGAFNAGANNAAVTTLTQSGGTYNSSGSLTVTGAATLTGGTMSGTGTTILQGASTLGGNGLDLDAGRILRNENTVTWTAGNMSLNPANNTGSGRIDNAVGALWDAQANNTISAPGFADVNSLAGFPAFNNAGTFRKSVGIGTTTIDVAFNNTGSLQVQTGTVNLTAGGTQTAGTISGPGTIQFGGGTHTADAASNINIANATFSGGTTTFNGTYNVSNTTTVSGGTASLQNGTLTSLGNALVISAGAFNAGANNAAVTTLTQSGGTYNSSGSLTVTGAATLTGGTMSGTGTTILQGASTLGGNGLDLDAGRILRNENTVTWTAGNMSLNPANNTGSGRIDNAVGALWDAQANNTISAPGFADVNSLAGFPAFNNAGTFRKSVGIGTTTIDVRFNNTGTVDVQTGTLTFSSTISQHVGATLTGGTWIVRDGATLGITTSGAQDITTNQGDVTLRGSGSTFARINSLVNNQGAFRLLDNRNFTAVGPFTNSGVLQLGGGAIGAPSLTNTSTGDINGFGSMTVRPTNNGVIRATGGTLAMSDGVASGGVAGSRVQVDAGASLNVSGGASGSRTHLLVNNGTLNVGTNTFVVDKDYTNAGFGSGNSFNPRANVTGAGPINAGGDVAQAITGTGVQNGTSATPTLVIGNLRAGENIQRTIDIANTGTNGPDLRGAIQTSVNGANLTDSRLSGSGVTAGNFGPVATGGSQALQVNFTGTSAGPLTGQQVRIVNNFDNVGDQMLNIVGATYQPAAASTLTTPVNLGNARVGGTLSTSVGVTNVAPNTGGFTETLGASVTGTTGGVQTSGSVSGLAQGASSSAISASFSTATAGAKSGSATLGFTTNEINGSGLGTAGIGSQTVNLSGNVYRLAQPTLGTINFGNVLVGSNPTSFLSVTNSALADGFSEGLNASLGTISGTSAGLLQGNGGIITNLAAGGVNANTLGLTLNTGNIGSVTANVQVLLASNGAGTSGLGVFDLPSQGVPISGIIQANVGNLAAASAATPNPVNLGNVRVGAPAPSQALTISNTIQVGEGLNASLSTATPGLTATGSFNNLAPGQVNNSSLVVGMNTGSAGSRNGTASIALTSDGTFNGGTPTPLAPQVVNVTGGVYQTASVNTLSTPVNLGNARVGGTLSTSLGLTNTASGPAGFVETLGASVSGTTGGVNVTGAPVSGLAAGASSNAMSAGFSTVSAGAKSGSATLAFTSSEVNGSGLGTIGIGSQTVNLSGNVYQPAAASTLTSPVNLGNARVGGTLSTSVGVTNVAPNTGGFTETLGASVTGTTGGVQTSGSVSGLAQGASSNAISASFSTATAGAKSGSATLGFTTNEIGGSGLGSAGIGSQAVDFSGGVYRLAQPTLGTINFGNVLVGSNPTGFLSVTNSALADGFSEGLNASLGTISGTSAGLLFSNGGVITNLAAGGVNANTLGLTLNTGNIGSVTANVQVLLASNGAGTSGLGVFDLPSQGVPISGIIQANVGNLAAASAATPNPVNLGNVRVGAPAPSQALSISNTIQIGEGLNASISTATPGLTATGSFNNLAPGLANTSSLVVGMNTATAGARNGTASIALTSDGTFNGGTPTPLAPQVVNVTGGVYQTASVNTLSTPINLGNTRVGGTLSTSLGLTNTASGPAGFVETLGASVSGTTGGVNVTGAPVSGLAAGASSNAISAGFSSASAGAKSGSATLAFTSSEVNGSGLGTIGIGSQTVNLSGSVYQPAAASTLTTPVNLGTVRTGTVVNTPLNVTNSASGPVGFVESLGASFGTTTSGLVGNGSVSGLAAGAGSNAMSVQYTAGAPGAFNGSAAVNFVSQEVGGSGLGNLSLTGQTVNFSANVNAIAALGIANQSPFTFTPTGVNSALLDFGTIPGASLLSAPLVLSNTAVGPSDSLLGSFILAGLIGSPFDITGEGNFDLIGSGSLPVSVQFNPSASGTFSASFVLALASHNASQNDLGLGSYTVTVRGQVGGVSPPSSVPDSPIGLIGALTMLATLALGHRHRRRMARS